MANADASFLSRRLDAGALPLAVVDVVAIVGLLTAGTVHHNGVAFVSANPLYLAGVLAPFLLGWVVAAPLLGAYSPGAAESAKAAIPLAVRSWIVADLVGVGLRATPIFSGGFAITFVAISLVTGLVAIVAVRWAYFRVR
jgi:hypothetical protein